MVHTTKKYFFPMFLALFLGANITVNAMSKKAIISTYQGVNGPWQLLEYLFISNVQNEMEHFQRNSFTALGIAGTAFLAKVFLQDSGKLNRCSNCCRPIIFNQDKATILNSKIKNLTVGLSALAAGKTIYDYATYIAKRNIQHKTLNNVLKNWNTYRLQLPTSLVEYFDELAEGYQKIGERILTNNLVTEVFELVAHHIEHHFESRYKKSEKEVNTIEAFKSCTSIWDNLK